MDRLLFIAYIAIWVLCVWSGREIFSRLHILDKPGKDVPKREPVPTLQWVVIITTFIVLLYITKQYFDRSFGREFLWLFLGGGVIAAISIVDEMWRIVDKRLSISALFRLVIQIVVASLAWYYSGVGIELLNIPFFPAIELSGFLSRLFTIAWFLLFINAINRFDGIYGLATGMSSIGFLTIFLLLSFVVFPHFEFMSYERSELLIRVQNISLILFVIWILGTVLEYKPWWLMRDVGTMFFGFALWYLALLWWAKIGTLIVVLALPLFDALRVFIDRLRRWKSPTQWDYSHLHYRLLALGWNRHEVRICIRWISLVFMIIMLLLWVDRTAKMIIFLLMATIFFGINIYLYRHKWLPSEYTPK